MEKSKKGRRSSVSFISFQCQYFSLIRWQNLHALRHGASENDKWRDYLQPTGNSLQLFVFYSEGSIEFKLDERDYYNLIELFIPPPTYDETAVGRS